MQTIVLASGNAGKLAELQHMLGTSERRFVTQRELDVDEPDETGLSFVENAIIKARHASAATGLPAIADDSGLEVDFLDGQPGIHSARYAGDAGDQANNEKLLAALAGVSHGQRTARFQCLIVYMRHQTDPTPLICQGTWEGFVLDAPRGDNGFGYDPLFYVPEHDCASAELPSTTKNRISHRARAMQQLLSHWQGIAR